jgi:hypothetical protein
VNIDQLFQKHGTSVLKIAEQKAAALARHPALADRDEEDIKHDLLVDLWSKWGGYVPARSAPLTFVVRIYNSTAKSLIRAEVAEKRDFRRRDGSLNAMVRDADGGFVERSQTIDARATTAHTGQHRRSDEEVAELRSDTTELLSGLVTDAADAARLLMQMSELAASAAAGKSRRAFHRDVEAAGSAWKKGDMDAYL